MPQKTKFHYREFLTPVSTNLSPFLMADDQLSVCLGVNPSYDLGVIRKDLGYSQIGSTLEATKPILGLHNFRQTAATQKMLATVDDATGDDTQLFYSTGGAWAEIGAAETAWANKASMDVEMEDFITYCFMVGYSATDGFLPSASLTGTTFSTSTNVTNMPGAKYIKRYRDRLYIANCDITGTAYPFRVYFSSVPSGSTISWTVASDFFDVDYSEAITGLGENWDRLIVFTENSAYMYNQTEKKKVWDTGCANNRTIKTDSSYMIWGDKDNIWISTGGTPAPIGNNILELIRNSDSTNWFAEIVDREYSIYLGDTAADGITYQNCVATYNIQTNMWRWRELYDDITTMTKFYSGGQDFLWLGCADGEVMKKSKYTDATQIYSDDGQPISAWFRTKAYDFGDPSIQKNIQKMVTYSELGNGLDVRYRIWDKQHESLMNFKNIGSLKTVVQEMDINATGNFIQFECKEISTNQAFKFYGFSVLLQPFNKLR
jgi:hypothetical protein